MSRRVKTVIRRSLLCSGFGILFIAVAIPGLFMTRSSVFAQWVPVAVNVDTWEMKPIVTNAPTWTTNWWDEYGTGGGGGTDLTYRIVILESGTDRWNLAAIHGTNWTSSVAARITVADTDAWWQVSGGGFSTASNYTYREGTTQTFHWAGAKMLVALGHITVTQASSTNLDLDCSGEYYGVLYENRTNPVYVRRDGNFFISVKNFGSALYVISTNPGVVGSGYWLASGGLESTYVPILASTGTASVIVHATNQYISAEFARRVMEGSWNSNPTALTYSAKPVVVGRATPWSNFWFEALSIFSPYVRGTTGCFDVLCLNGVAITNWGQPTPTSPPFMGTLTLRFFYPYWGEHSAGTLYITAYDNERMYGWPIYETTATVSKLYENPVVIVSNTTFLADAGETYWFAWMDANADGVFNNVFNVDPTLKLLGTEPAAIAEFNPCYITSISNNVEINFHMVDKKGTTPRFGWSTNVALGKAQAQVTMFDIGASTTTVSWTLIGGGSHGSADWTLSADSIVAGDHYNVKTFTINAAVTATVNSYVTEPVNGGRFTVRANNIIINGRIKANGVGYLGGNAGGGGAGSSSPTSEGLGGTGYGAAGSPGTHFIAGFSYGGIGVAGYGSYGGGVFSGRSRGDGGGYNTTGSGGPYFNGQNAVESQNYNLYMGSGGGGGHGGGTVLTSGASGGGAGAKGGGAVYLYAQNTITVADGAIIACQGLGSGGGANGSVGGAGGNGGSNLGSGTSAGGSGTNPGGGGGGGSGGGVLFSAKTVVISNATVDVLGYDPTPGVCLGADGSIKVFYETRYAAPGVTFNYGQFYQYNVPVPTVTNGVLATTINTYHRNFVCDSDFIYLNSGRGGMGYAAPFNLMNVNIVPLPGSTVTTSVTVKGVDVYGDNSNHDNAGTPPESYYPHQSETITNSTVSFSLVGSWLQYSSLGLGVYIGATSNNAGSWNNGASTASGTLPASPVTTGTVDFTWTDESALYNLAEDQGNKIITGITDPTVTGWVNYATAAWYLDFGVVNSGTNLPITAYYLTTNLPSAYVYSGYLENEHTTNNTAYHLMSPDRGGPTLIDGTKYYWRARVEPATVSSNMPQGAWSSWGRFFYDE